MTTEIDIKPTEHITDEPEFANQHLTQFVLETTARHKDRGQRYKLSSHRKRVSDRRIAVARLIQENEDLSYQDIADLVAEHAPHFLKEGQRYDARDVSRDVGVMRAKNREELNDARFDMLIAQLTDLDVREMAAEEMLDSLLEQFHNRMTDEIPPDEINNLVNASTKIFDTLHKISLRKSGLVGLDAPKQQEHKVQSVNINLDGFLEARRQVSDIRLTEHLLTEDTEENENKQVIEGEFLENPHVEDNEDSG